MIRISVILWDCSFREKFHAIESYLNQTLDSKLYEVIWVEFYKDVKPEVKEFLKKYENFKILTLNKTGKWQYGICVNEGVKIAKGDVLVISDGDVVVDNKFLEDELSLFEKYPNIPLINYHRRYDEPRKPLKYRYDIEYLKENCILTNPSNYAGCFSIRKKDFIAINGYEEDMIFSGPSACAKDFYIRAKNAGYFIRWSPDKRLFHPWHPGTAPKLVYLLSDQEKIIAIRDLNVSTMPNIGFDKRKNKVPPDKPKIDTIAGKVKFIAKQFIRQLIQ